MGYEDLREKLEAHQAYVIGGAGLVILLCVVYVIVSLTGGGPVKPDTQTTLIYYDVPSQTIRLVDYDIKDGTLPASPMAGTTETFLATVWYCGKDPGDVLNDGMTRSELEAAGLFIGWLEKEDPQGAVTDYVLRPMVYRTLDRPQWQKSETLQAMAIIESPYTKCQDATQYFVR